MCVWKSFVCVVFLRYARGDNNNIRLSVVWWCRCCLIKKTLATLSNSERKSCLLDVRFLFNDLPSYNAWEVLRFLIEMLSRMLWFRFCFIFTLLKIYIYIIIITTLNKPLDSTMCLRHHYTHHHDPAMSKRLDVRLECSTQSCACT